MSPVVFYNAEKKRAKRAMDGREVVEMDGNLKLEQRPHHLKVAIAISGRKESKSILGWALEKFVQEGNVFMKLIHIRPRIAGVPTASKLCLFQFLIHVKSWFLLFNQIIIQDPN